MVKFQKMHSPPHPDPLIVGLFIVLDLWEGGTPGLVQASSAHGSVYQNPGFPTRGCAGNQPVYPAVRETLTSTYLESHYVSRKTEYVTVPVLLGPGSCGCPMLVRVTGISRDQVHIARGLPPSSEARRAEEERIMAQQREEARLRREAAERAEQESVEGG